MLEAYLLDGHVIVMVQKTLPFVVEGSFLLSLLPSSGSCFSTLANTGIKMEEEKSTFQLLPVALLTSHSFTCPLWNCGFFLQVSVTRSIIDFFFLVST